MPPVTEIHFFDRDFEWGIRWYETRFSGRDRADTFRARRGVLTVDVRVLQTSTGLPFYTSTCPAAWKGKVS